MKALQRSDLSDMLREAVERAQTEFSEACAGSISKEAVRAAADNLEEAVIRLNNYIRQYLSPGDWKDR